MTDKETFRCLEDGCDGTLREIDRRPSAGGYDLIQYMCGRCAKEFYRADYPNADMSHEQKQSLISRVGRT